MRSRSAAALGLTVFFSLSLAGCSSSTPLACEATDATQAQSGTETFTAEGWADNWFALSVDGVQIAEDIVPITTERSFNAQCVTFQASYPFTLGLVSKDFVENESGLEYIGESNQQMGDGGVILQVTDSSGAVVAATSSDWRGLSIFRAPLNTDCESSSDPLADCESEILPEPAGWAEPGFDDSGWSPATEYTEAEVQAKDGYTQVTWDATAKLIWADDLNVDNTILWRYTVTG
jgi:hypothetical protein